MKLQTYLRQPRNFYFLLLNLACPVLNPFAVQASEICQKNVSQILAQMNVVRLARQDLMKRLSGFSPEISYPWAGNSLYEGVFREFEDDYLALLARGDPTLFGQAFREKWGLSEKQFLDVLTFYAVEIWEDSLLTAFDSSHRTRALNRLRLFRFSNYIKNSNSSLGQVASKSLGRILLTPRDYFIYFHQMITQKSVPQMADDLGLNEFQIYSLLSQLQISIDKKWSASRYRKLFEQIDTLSPNHLTPSKIQSLAAEHSVGGEALEFFLHYSGKFQKGRLWTATEEELIKTLRMVHNLSIAQIADRLSRTENSVSAKLASLGLVDSKQRGADFVIQPPYGVLKESGEINLEPLMAFVVGTGIDRISTLAEILEVQKESLIKFVVRQKIEFLFSDLPLDTLEKPIVDLPKLPIKSVLAEALSKAQTQYQSQREIVDGWINEARLLSEPLSGENGLGQKLKNHVSDIEQFFHGDPVLFFEALQSALEVKGLADRLLLTSLNPHTLQALMGRDLPAHSLALWDQLKIRNAFSFLIAKIPSSQKMLASHTLGFRQIIKLLLHEMREWKVEERLVVFEKVFRELKSKNLLFHFPAIGIYFANQTMDSHQLNRLKALQKETSLEIVLKYIHQNPEGLSKWNLEAPGPFEPNEFKKLTGRGVYQKDLSIYQIYENRFDFWLDVYILGESRGIEVPLWDIQVKYDSTEASQRFVRTRKFLAVKEAFDNFIQDPKSEWNFEDFRSGRGLFKVPNRFGRIVDTRYPDGQENEEFFLSLFNYAKSRGSHYDLLRVKFEHKGLNPEFLKALHECAGIRAKEFLLKNPGWSPESLSRSQPGPFSASEFIKLAAMDSYRPGAVSAHLAIFANKQALIDFLKNFLAANTQ